MKLRIGFIGTGMMGLAHVQCVRDEFPQASLAAVYDPHEPSVQRAREAAPTLKVCKSPDELLASDVDAVIISTPGFRHRRMSKSAFRRETRAVREAGDDDP
jgi:predicted dehydrogenase